MNSKLSLRLISVLGSSLLVTVQLAPLVKAQGNMSDATGMMGSNLSDATGVMSNLSDATGLLAQLLAGTEFEGILITQEILNLINLLNSGNIAGFQSQLLAGLLAAGVPEGLAMQCVQSFEGLLVNGQLNLSQLALAGDFYLQILQNPSLNLSILLGGELFAPITGLLAIFNIASGTTFAGSQNIQTLAALSVGRVIGGITITTQIQQLIVTSIVSQATLESTLIAAGVPPALANDCVGSLNALFGGGPLSAVQLQLAAQFYLDILASPGVNASLLGGGLFASVPGLLTALSAQSSVTFNLSQTISTLAAFPIGAVIGGVTITAQFQLLIGASIGGRAGLQTALINAGVPLALAIDCVGSLGALFAGGSFSAAQLDFAAQFYLDILATPGVNVSVLGGGLFASVPGLLTALSAQSSVTFNLAQTIQALSVAPLGGTIGGVAVTLEIQQLIVGLSSSNQTTLISLQTALTDAGVSLVLAQNTVNSLIGLFGSGGFNAAGVGLASQLYLEILFTSGVNITTLNSGIFASVPGLLTAAFASQNSQILNAFPVGQVFNGVTITQEIQLLILASTTGSLGTWTNLQTAFSRSGISASVGSSFAASLSALFANGQFNQSGLQTVLDSYLAIVTTRTASITGLQAFAEFQLIQTFLTALGVDVTIPVLAGVPTGPGNLSDATNVSVSIPAEQTTEEEEVTEEPAAEQTAEQPAEQTAEQPAEQTAEQPAEQPAEQTAEQPAEQTAEQPAEQQQQSEVSNPASNPPPTAPVGGLAATSQIQSTTTSTTVVQQQTLTTNVTTNTNVNNNGAIADPNHAGAITASNAVVTSSSIAGGFVFASVTIVAAVMGSAQSLVARLGSGVASFGGFSISVEAQVTVVSVMTSSSVSVGSVPTYVSSLNGGGALVAAAPVDTYVNSLIDGGVPNHYAQALAATMDGIIILDSDGEVSGVDPTKLTTAIAVYNQTINQLSPEALSEPSETLVCTGLVLSSLGQAASGAASE